MIGHTNIFGSLHNICAQYFQFQLHKFHTLLTKITCESELIKCKTEYQIQILKFDIKPTINSTPSACSKFLISIKIFFLVINAMKTNVFDNNTVNIHLNVKHKFINLINFILGLFFSTIFNSYHILHCTNIKYLRYT